METANASNLSREKNKRHEKFREKGINSTKLIKNNYEENRLADENLWKNKKEIEIEKIKLANKSEVDIEKSVNLSFILNIRKLTLNLWKKKNHLNIYKIQ